MPACARRGVYVPRQTHDCDAAVLVRRHLPGFLARLEEAGHALPGLVKAELEGFASCGDFERGFVRTASRTFEEVGADVRFLPARAPTPERMTAVLAQVHKAIAAVAEDDDLDMDPALAACVQFALAGPHAVPPPELAARSSLTVSAFDMHLHAATTVDGRDRKQLERVCRYMLRPPFAHDAVKELEGGRVSQLTIFPLERSRPSNLGLRHPPHLRTSERSWYSTKFPLRTS